MTQALRGLIDGLYVVRGRPARRSSLDDIGDQIVVLAAAVAKLLDVPPTG